MLHQGDWIVVGSQRQGGRRLCARALGIAISFDGGVLSGNFDAVIRWRLTWMFYGVNRPVARDGKLLRW